jgi:hypothetical protein
LSRQIFAPLDDVNFRSAMDAASLRPPVTGPWWRRLGQRLRPRDRRPVLGLAPIGLDPQRDAALCQAFDALGQQLGLRFDLDDPEAQIVLMDVDYAGRTPTDLVRGQTRGRPAVLVERTGTDREALESLRLDLLRQLATLPILRQRLHARATPWAEASGPAPASTLAPASAGLSTIFDSDLDSRLQAEQWAGESPDAEQRALVARALQGLRDPGAPPLRARYSDGAILHADFASRLVTLDPLALHGLRVRRALPRLDDDAPPPTWQAVVHDLDEVIWHLGMACGRYVLLGQPDDAWHAMLVDVDVGRIEQHSRQPRHLELMRRLQQGAASPSALRRHVRIGVPELRGFLQACLFLGLLEWAEPARTGQNFV